MKHLKLVGAIALSLSLAAGCQAPMSLHQMKQPWFALGEADTLGVSTSSDLTGGRLTVRFAGELAGMRRVQAVVADVDKVVVTVKTQDGVAVSQTVLKAALNNGQTSVTFSGLTPGSATVTIAAFDAAGVNIGSTSKVASIVAGQVASVDINMQLSPTFIEEVGGGGSPAMGGLLVNGGILDGPVQVGPNAPAGTLLGVTTGLIGTALAPAGAGAIWMVGYEGVENPQPMSPPFKGYAIKVSAAGEVVKSAQLSGRPTDVAIGSDNHLWVAGEFDDGGSTAYVYQLDSEGVEQSRVEVSAGVKSMTSDSSGNLFVGSQWDSTVTKVAAGVKTIFPPNWGGRVVDVAVDGEGLVWDLRDATLTAYTAAGMEVRSISIIHYSSPGVIGSVAIDKDGNPWTLRGDGVDGVLEKFSRDGVRLGRWTGYNVPGNLTAFWSSQHLVPDPQGGMWVRGPNRVDKRDALGNVLLSLQVPTPTNQAGGMLIQGNTLWVTDGDSRLYRFAL